MVGTATASAAIINPPNNLGLTGYWSMEDGGGAKLTDFSGKGRTGDLVNMEDGDWVAGKRGKALSFDGVDERVVLPSNLFSSNTLTVSLWAKFNVINSFQGLFSIYTSSGDQMEISVIDSNASIYGGNYGNRAISATNAISVGSWHHIALTSNGSVTQLYVNGMPSGTTGTTNFSTFNLPAYLGTDGNGTEHPFNGLIDDVRIYSRALSSTEIATLYAQANISKVKNSAQGLVGLWPFDEVSGTSVIDKTGKGNNGTLLPVPTSISRVQYNHTYPGTSGASLAFSGSVTTGNLIIVTASGSGGAISTVSDNCSNTYAEAVAGSVGITSSAIWYAYNVTGGSCTVTVTSTMTDFGMSIFEYSGTSAGNPLLTTHTDLQKKTGTAFSTTADGMVFVHWANESGGSDASGYGSGWSGIQHDTSHYDLQEENTTATAGSYTPSVGGADQGSDVLLAAAFRGLDRPTRIGGKYGGAVKFDGIDDFVGFGDVPELRIESRPFTISAWVTVSAQPSVGNGANIVAKGMGGSGGYGLQYVNSGGTYQLSLTKYGVVDQLITQTLSLNTWHHIVAVQTSTQVEYFLNGASIGTYSNSSAYASSAGFNFNIGLMSNSSLNPWNGLIDDVRVYSRALSAQEVANLYSSSGEGFAVINASMNNLLTTGLIGLWSFNGADISGVTAYDRSGQGNNGTLTNGPVPAIGVTGQALRFAVTDDFVAIPGTILNSIEPNGSISLWISFDASWNSSRTTEAYAFESEKAGIYNQLYLRFPGSDGRLYFGKNAADGLNTPEEFSSIQSSWTAKQWYHLVAVWQGTAMRMYINGALDNSATKTSGINSNADTARIGNHRVGTLAFPGRIDDFRIYNRSLSQPEILQLYGIGR